MEKSNPVADLVDNQFAAFKLIIADESAIVPRGAAVLEREASITDIARICQSSAP
jgi:hypothetical protein